jgi:predicted nucleic acid-binding protein
MFVALEARLRSDSRFTVIPATAQLFDDGLELYRHRPDKDWSLTDCIPFMVMQQRGIVEAFTGDHHFEQAGFVALLK